MCCQLGAREHFAVPRALERLGKLQQLFTDVWTQPKGWGGFRTNGVAGRFHHALTNSDVIASNVGAIRFALTAKARGRSGWELITARNEWFQDFVLKQLQRADSHGNSQQVTVFAYSYAANRIFTFARERGWRTVLGQIDAGPAEEELVASLHREAKNTVGHWEAAPADYWQQWRSECALADHIVVNSTWSRDALVSQNIEPKKIKTIPLAFECSDESTKFKRRYPSEFNSNRPMRVLFLGQICLRKGVDQVFEAIRLLEGQPIEFWFVGPVHMKVPVGLRNDSRVRWHGRVSRSRVARYYRSADVFLFPTLSDGFGLTQLEAQSWKLPVIASIYCGSVVRNGVNGLLLQKVSGSEIADALSCCLRHPGRLQQMSSQCEVSDEFSLSAIGTSLINL